MLHRDEKAAAIFKEHSAEGSWGESPGVLLEIVGCQDPNEPWYGDSDNSSWVICHDWKDLPDDRDDWSKYLAVHRNRDTASIFCFDWQRIALIGG